MLCSDLNTKQFDENIFNMEPRDIENPIAEEDFRSQLRKENNSKSFMSCESCIWYSSAKMCKDCDEYYSEFKQSS